MKSLKEVESNRIAYHSKPLENTVHRASLLVPELPGLQAEISFLNHFLIKRKYENVALKITAINKLGKRIKDLSIEINEPKVYRFNLGSLLETSAHTYIVEFYSSKNLYIPFPAVMVNHVSPNSRNQVHSFNRVLNDVFEDEKINSNHVREASIDVHFNAREETFILFQSGPQALDDKIHFSIDLENQKLEKTVNIQLPRLCHRMFKISEIFPDIQHFSGAILKVSQPRQFMFYGRLMCGLISTDGSVIANHSYYDSSETEEYWDSNKASIMHYPIFSGLQQKLRFYPILSPSELKLTVTLFGSSGDKLAEAIELPTLRNPSNDFVEIDIDKVSTDYPASTSYIVEAFGDKVPTRVNHQLIYKKNAGLETSINLSLKNPNIFTPDYKKSFVWGQLYQDENYSSHLGISSIPISNSEKKYTGILEIYSEEGLICEQSVEIGTCNAITWSTRSLVPDAVGALWFTFKTDYPHISSFSVIENEKTHHCSGEHGF